MEEQTEAPTPTLGSLLLKSTTSKSTRPLRPLSSGLTFIDKLILQGGFKYGEITSIAGAHGTGKSIVAFHAVASHLLCSPSGDVAVIDTSGTFSPVRLRDVLAFRLCAQRQRTSYHQSGYVYKKQETNADTVSEELVQEATAMLDRVKLMRVFDVAGLTEAVSEIAVICEQSTVNVVANQPVRRAVVEDSEDDLSVDDAGDEFPSNGQQTDSLERQNDEVLPSWDGKIGMVIVDTIPSVFGPLLAKNQIQGQALLTSFMRSLRHMTAQRHICTILNNSVVGQNLSKSSQYYQRPEDYVSIFSSIVGKPALGKSFTHLVDTSIMLSTLPMTKEDADIVYGHNPDGKQARYAGVFEVIHDKYSSRAESWAAFEIVNGIDLRACTMTRV